MVASFFVHNKVFRVPRARVLVWNEHGELLLVRGWIGRNEWGLPGGGVNKGEAPEVAARRELKEEIGIDVPLDSLGYAASIAYHYEAVIYSTQIDAAALPLIPYNPWEITDIRWFAPEHLPTDLSPLVVLALKKLPKQG